MELLLIERSGLLRHYGAAMQIFLDGKKYLIGVYGLDEVVGNFVSNSLIHNVFLLALGNHDYGYIRV